MAKGVSGWLLAASALVVAAGSGAAVRAVADEPRVSRDVLVGQSGVWTATDLNVDPGERVVFAAKGEAQCPGAGAGIGPDGMARGFRDLLRILPMPQVGRGALIGPVRAVGSQRA